MSRVSTIISAHFKSWYRSRSNIFWTIAFPLLLIVLFGAIFGNGSTKFDLYVQNQDLIAATPTPLSLGYVATLNNTGAFTLHMVPAEQQQALDFVKSDAQLHNRGQRLLVVPTGFAANLNNTKNASVQLYIDKSDQASASLAGVVNAATASYATELSRSNPNNVIDNVNVQPQSIITRNVRYIDFFIPGVIGMTLLTSGVFGAVNVNGRYRELKIIKKLATTPLSKIEWILGMVGYQMIIATISIVVILFFGWAIFGVTVTIDIYTVGLVIAAGLLFPGIGMVLANFVKEAEGADAAANAITFPMMFLSGTFWPRETLPDILKVIAGFMPLTYINDGLRDSMIYLQPTQALTNTIIALGLAGFFIVLGSLLMNWKEE
jgi:ABC-2 type transport system permease protein